jgi:hypothetical protein
MKVPVCLNDNSLLYVEGEVIGIWSVAPGVGTCGRRHVFTAAAWSVRSAENGLTVGSFFERAVAVRYAHMLMRTYGDISANLRRNYQGCETAFDNVLFDEILARSKHESRVANGTKLPWIKLATP